jgi:hypothetical protein
MEDKSMEMLGFLTEHIHRDRPERPQSYLEHGTFAMKNSLWLIVAGLAGVVHAIFPWWFKFYSAEQVIRIYCRIARSGRHDDLMAKYRVRRPGF